MAEGMIMRRGGTVGFGGLPVITYTGQYELIDDGKGADGTQNWRIKFLTSGELTSKYGMDVDVFLVGGGGSGGFGGGGGGGGYTENATNRSITRNTPYEIIVGAGGDSVTDGNGLAGGDTSAFGVTAKGGSGGGGYNNANTGSGGSGGGASGAKAGEGSVAGADGGSDGSDGGSTVYWPAANGQGTTTREFGESDGELYSGGGGGGAGSDTPSGKGGAGGGGNGGGFPGEVNTGGGGGAAHKSTSSGAGGSGIVIIRNTRSVTA